MDTEITGLTEEQALEERTREQEKQPVHTITRSTWQIIKENVFTLFNLLNFSIAALLFIVKAYTNMLFLAIIVLNIVIDIFQELKAKRLLDRLSLLNRPQVTLIRNGEEKSAGPEDVVKGDVMVLESGRQIVSDAVVLSGSIEVNESLLTGESDAIVKEAGDSLLSGSSVISGKCYARVTKASGENYIQKLQDEVKEEQARGSELLSSMKKVTHFTGYLIVPLGILLFLEAFFLRGDAVNAAVVSTSAALLGMLPKGLVLLITVSLANGVIRLAKKNILVQNIYSLETLARVDVLCLDKTGTLTDGKMKVKKADFLGGADFDQDDAEDLLSSYLAASDDNNATIEALKKKFTPYLAAKPTGRIPFSSKRKWGAVSFGANGTVYLGAPEKIPGSCTKDAEQALEQGYRLLAVGYSESGTPDRENIPDDVVPLYLITLEDNIRKNAAEALGFFDREGIEVKVISGDHVKTVSMIAKKAGVRYWDRAVDMSEVGSDVNYRVLCEKYNVFARVTPEQKKKLVEAMQKNGHRVAMTGDGVNDLPALRKADCSIAVAEGSDASRQISQIVLLESDFTHLPQVVLEGRKVVNNVTRTAGVFFIKTIYSVLLSFICLITLQEFPFIPIQITLIDAAMEAYPSFITIIESDTEKIRGSFLKKAFGNAFPFALTAVCMMMFIGLFTPFSAEIKQTMMYYLLILTTMSAVIKSCIPFTPLRTFICVTMVIGTFAALHLFPTLLHISVLFPAAAVMTALVFVMGAALFLLLFKWKGSFFYRAAL
ncbi:MAG: HAD-IC family P-type ATPase [Candidatus Weimeria sp.]